MDLPQSFNSVEEELAYYKKIVAAGSEREAELEQLVSKQKTLGQTQRSDLDRELNTATERAQYYKRQWETAKQKLEILSSQQTSLTTSTNKELSRLQETCSRLEAELETAKTLVREMEQANERYQEKERAALASLEEAERSLEAYKREDQARKFELVAARNVISELNRLHEENLDLRADLEHYTMRLNRQEEESSSNYELESNETWENEPPRTRTSPSQSAIHDWVDDFACTLSLGKEPVYQPKRSSMLKYDDPQL